MKKKKKPMTLLEIMIVIFIIGIIGSVIGYNMKGSLDEGKAFKSKEGSRQIYEILVLEVAKGRDINVVEQNYVKWLEESGMVKNVNDLCKDGWGQPYQVILKDSQYIKIISTPYLNYLNKKGGNKNLPVWMDEAAIDG